MRSSMSAIGRPTTVSSARPTARSRFPRIWTRNRECWTTGHLAACGFYAKSPNLRAGIVDQLGAKQFATPVHFIVERKNGRQYASFYAKPGEEVGAELVTDETVNVLQLPDRRGIPVKQDGKWIYFTMPSLPNTPANCTIFVKGVLK